jgi:photosystem II stability/assembly factor-like uncharacterized protein
MRSKALEGIGRAARLAGWVLGAALAAAGAASAAAGTGSFEAVVSGTAHQALYGIAFEGQSGIAVGAFGAVLETQDGGRTWKGSAKAPTPLALLGAEIRGERRLAVGQSGLILRRQGAGEWERVDSGTDKRLFSVSSNAHGLAFAVGGFGTVLASADDGRTWKAVAFDWSAYVKDTVEPHLYRVVVEDDGTVTIVGEFEMILRSTDGGRKWTLLHKGEASLFDLELRADGTGFAVGQKGAMLRTADHGRTWARVDTGSTAVLLGVCSGLQGRILVTGMREMISSRDDGRTWEKVTLGDAITNWYQGIAPAPQAGAAFVVGHSGRIVRLQD